MLWGRRSRSALRSSHLPRKPFIFRSDGTVAANSISTWSTSGQRTSERALHRRDVDLGEDVVDQVVCVSSSSSRPSASVAVASDSRRPNKRPARVRARRLQLRRAQLRHLLGREVAELRGVARDVAHQHAPGVRPHGRAELAEGARLAPRKAPLDEARDRPQQRRAARAGTGAPSSRARSACSPRSASSPPSPDSATVTWRRVISRQQVRRQRRRIGERLAVGVHQLGAAARRRSGAAPPRGGRSRRARATWRAYVTSEKSFSSKPIENVLTGFAPTLLMIATTADESMPPDRNAPSGTSDTRRIFTASNRWWRSSSTKSSAERCRGAKRSFQ